MVNYHAGSLAVLSAPERQISGYPPASASRTTLTRISLCRLFLVASSLLPLFCRLFFVASSLLPLSCYLFFVPSLGALHSASCRSPLFLLERLSGPGCWSSHQVVGHASV